MKKGDSNKLSPFWLKCSSATHARFSLSSSSLYLPSWQQFMAAAAPFEQPLGIAAAEEDWEAFVVSFKRATTDRSSHEYNELYQFLLKCFTLADNDFDARSD